MGPAASRRQVLGRHAELICIPRDKLNKEYVKATLEEWTGLPLHTAFATSAASGPGVS